MKPLILIAAPGAGSAGDSGLNSFEQDLRRHFSTAEVGWIYTSTRLLERAQKEGKPVLSPSEGVERLQSHSGPAAILSLHLVAGREYGHLSEAFAANRNPRAFLSRPLLESPDVASGLIQALFDTNPIDRDEVRILVTHGSPEPEGKQTLVDFADLARKLDPATIMASLLGEPDFSNAARFCQERGIHHASLVPLLMTGGPSTQSLSNPDDPALLPLRQAGISTRSAGWGLLSISEFRQICLMRVDQGLQTH